MKLKIIKTFKTGSNDELIASIKFPDNTIPTHNQSINIDDVEYRIAGVVGASNVNDVIKMESGIYDCLLRRKE